MGRKQLGRNNAVNYWHSVEERPKLSIDEGRKKQTGRLRRRILFRKQTSALFKIAWSLQWGKAVLGSSAVPIYWEVGVTVDNYY